MHAQSSPPEIRLAEGNGGRGSFLTLGALCGLLLLLVVGASNGTYTPTLPVFVIAAAVVISLGTRLLRWRNLFVLLLLVILFIPIRRYTLASSVGFQLEPYRLVVFAIVPLWIMSLLIDPRVRLRRTGFEAQLMTIVFVTFASIVLNTSRINALGVQSIVTKKITFFLSFIVIVYFIASVLAERYEIDLVIKTLVGGGAVLSFFALVEFNTGFDIFDHVQHVVPLLRVQDTGFHSLEVRGGRVRVYGSGQHPIAYGAALLMLVPMAIYLARRTRSRRWMIAAVLLTLGALATVSRTGILMIIVMLVIYARLYPKQTRRLWPLVIPALVVIHIALPGSIGTVTQAFFPKGGLVKEQQGGKGTDGSGRVADLGPALGEASHTLLLGQGYATRVTDAGPLQNAPILDDQWLGTLLETGLLGVMAWLWLFVGFVRRMLRRAREDLDSHDSWLYAALAASIASFAFGMMFYDAFSFIQVTFFAFVFIAIGAVSLRGEAEARRRSA